MPGFESSLGLVMMPFYHGSKVRPVPESLRRRYGREAHLFNALSFAVATVLIGGVNLFALGLVLSLTVIVAALGALVTVALTDAGGFSGPADQVKQSPLKEQGLHASGGMRSC